MCSKCDEKYDRYNKISTVVLLIFFINIISLFCPQLLGILVSVVARINVHKKLKF